MTWPNGKSYAGEWEGGKQNGEGVLTLESGDVVESFWKGGRQERHQRTSSQQQ
jgi:hypothetical protein